MRRSNLGALNQADGVRRSLEVLGCLFGEGINKPFSPPVSGREARSITFLGLPDVRVGLVSGHPHQLAAGDERRDVTAKNMRDSLPNPGEGPGVVGGVGGAPAGGGDKRLAISTHSRREGAVLEDDLERPRLSGVRRGAPRRWPA